MKIVWDEPKRKEVLEARGLAFEDVTPDFFDGSVTLPAHSGRTISVGRLTIGPAAGMMVALVWAPRGSEAVSLVTMRPASTKERRIHDAAKADE